MTKYLITAQITVNGVDQAVALEDSATYTGGSAAKSQILMRKDVHVKAPDGAELYIPFHAIMMAAFLTSTDTVEDPEDTFCVEPDTAADGGDDEGGDDEGGDDEVGPLPDNQT